VVDAVRRAELGAIEQIACIGQSGTSSARAVTRFHWTDIIAVADEVVRLTAA
jgi:hypothetical protein